jgi:dihydroorotate dehydrogenase (fumarate)
MGPDKYLDHLAAIKAAVKVPVIASLNGVSKGGWTRYAHFMQEAGADAIELNMYYLPGDPDLTGQELEDNYVELVGDVKNSISIPLAAKLSPFITALPNFARRLSAAGVDGLVLFNRFYQPDFDLDELEVVRTLELSHSSDLLLPLRWISILHGKVDVDLALTSGIHTAEDILKAMMAGARVAMSASMILHDGYEKISSVLEELENWMEEHEYDSIKQMQGSMSQQSVAEPAAFERSNYIQILNSYRDLP